MKTIKTLCLPVFFILALAIGASAQIKAWGRSDQGQLGNNSSSSPKPNPVNIGLSDVIGIGGGELHTLMLRGNGTVLAFGWNPTGQIGNGTSGGNAYTPFAVPGLTNVIQVTGGSVHSAALKADGTVWSWGSNFSGQIGVGTTTTSGCGCIPSPTQTLIADVIQIDAGGQHTLALKSDGTVWAWGNNVNGKIGDGTTITRPTPVQVGVGVFGFNNIIAVSAGGDHSMALKSDGTVWTWGNNASGQSGNGSAGLPILTPVQNTTLTNVAQISGGFEHSVALKTNGTVWVWGYNGQGQIGNGSSGGNQPTPVQNITLTNVVDISAGNHSLARKNDGSVWAWGENFYGQIGNGTTNTTGCQCQPSPVQSAVGIGNILIGAGHRHSFAKFGSAAPPNISGRITRAGLPLSNVEVRLTGSVTTNTLTNSNGEYSFANLVIGGSYTVSPVSPTDSFLPASRTYSSLIGNRTNQDFAGTQTGFIVEGQVDTVSGGIRLPLPQTTITANCGAAGTYLKDTEADGKYRFIIPAGNCTITPTKSNYTFTPASVNIGVNSDQIVNFTAQTTQVLGGRIAYKDVSLDALGVMNADGSGAQILPNTGNVNFTNNGSPGSLDSFGPGNSPSISPDGSKIAFSRIVRIFVFGGTLIQQSRIFTMNFDGSNQQIITEPFSGNDNSPVWSPNGQEIAFIRYANSRSTIHIVNISSGNIRTVATLTQSYVRSLSWSPDGTKIAFERKPSTNPVPVIQVINANTGMFQSTLNPSSVGSPAFSPDGTKIAFIKYSLLNQPPGRIALMNPDGTNVSFLTGISNPFFNDVSWSPDSSYLAFSRITSPTLGILSRDGATFFDIADKRTKPSWSRTFTIPTPAGAVALSAGAVDISFNSVSGAGETTILPIPPTSAGAVPGGYVVGEFGAYEIFTTAVYSPPVTVCFTVPETTSETQFNLLSILHGEGGTLVDRTSSRDFNSWRICATVNSLSPFVIAEQIDSAKPSIRGLVRDNNGNPLSNVEVRLTEDETRKTNTDIDGLFTFPNLNAGADYNVQPKRLGYIFAEYSRNFTDVSGENAVVFVGTTHNFGISGRVTDGNGNGVPDLGISLSGAGSAETVTDADGYYSFTGLAADGSYLVSPPDAAFNPRQVFIEALIGNVTTANFTTIPPNEVDTDFDEVVDLQDNCPFNFNPDQTDSNNNGIGDVCEPDSTPPVITPSVSGTLGNNDWFTSNVSISWTVTDEESEVPSQNGCEAQTVTADTSGVTFTCSATSEGGTTSQSVTVKRDATPPNISFSSRTPANASGWNNTNVEVQWSCSDALSGAVAASVNQTVSTEGLNQNATGICQDNAGNTASDTQTGMNIDKTAPVLNPTVSPNPVLLGGNATASANATDILSGIASQSCAAVDTSSVGDQTVSCTATDIAGNTANSDASYRVIYNFAGFFQPVDNLPTLNITKAGSAIPVKFSLSGYQGLNIFAPGFPVSGIIPCDGSTTATNIEETVNAGGSSLSYDAGSDRYNYVWKTDKSWEGQCRQLIVRLKDGSIRAANFQFR